jgi:hypothetical protein
MSDWQKFLKSLKRGEKEFLDEAWELSGMEWTDTEHFREWCMGPGKVALNRFRAQNKARIPIALSFWTDWRKIRALRNKT